MIIRKVKPRQAVKQALFYRLFVNGWELHHICKMIDKDQYKVDDYVFVIAYNNGIPIGIGVKEYIDTKKPQNCIMAYVKPKYRKMGIGSRIVKKLVDKWSHAEEGIKGSETFWTKNNLTMWQL